jgi:predicted phosphodiesterase
MRIAVISDIHGNLAALEAVHRDIRVRGVDQIVNLGDSLSGPLLPLETARYLMAEGWLSLAGNHERQLLTLTAGQRCASDAYAHAQLGPSEFHWLRSLPGSARGEHGVLFCHGTPRADNEYFLESVDPTGLLRAASAEELTLRLGHESAALVLCGHTHFPRVVQTAPGQLLVNPGSVGLQAYDDAHPVDHVIETGSPDARYGIVDYQSSSGWTATLITVPYDHVSMARLARQRNRPDWELALLTGHAR